MNFSSVGSDVVCALPKYKTGSHHRPHCSAGQPRGLKHDQIKARGFVPEMRFFFWIQCYFCWNVNDCGFCCVWIIWSGPLAPNAHEDCSLCVSPLLVSVWRVSFSTLFLQMFFGTVYCFELVPLHPHTSGGPVLQQVSHSIFSQGSSKIALSLLHIISVSV